MISGAEHFLSHGGQHVHTVKAPASTASPVTDTRTFLWLLLLTGLVVLMFFPFCNPIVVMLGFHHVYTNLQRSRTSS